MKQQDYTTTILTADEGMVLTQAADVPLIERVFGSTVSLGRNDNVSNWCEITETEAEALKSEQKAELDRMALELEATSPSADTES